MKCLVCGEEMHVSKHETITFTSKIVGDIKLRNVEMLVCRNKHTEDRRLLTAEQADYVSRQVRSLESKKISKLPISEFVDAAEAANILGTTKRSMANLIRARSNLFVIYKVGSHTLLYRKSVIEYKATGDGRVLIVRRSL